jgi:photosystem II stability/assembly factor-like uncharacterized protein
MKYILGLTFLALILNLGHAQSYDSTLFDHMAMRSVGPAGMSGRVTSIDVNSFDNNHIVIGTASGGIWESKSGGITWKPIFDKEAVQSIGAIAISERNPHHIWAGTGEGNPRNSQTSGKGIYKSIDGGKSWKLMGLEKTKTIHRVIIDKHDENTIFVGALGSAWGPNKERGVFKSTDGGETWKNVLYVNDSTGCADLVVDPNNPKKMIAAMWHYNRQPWFFTSGGTGSGIYITYDGGENWKRLDKKSGLPGGSIGRSGLTICHDKPNVVYALVESKKTALYRSNDGGENWHKVSDKNIGNRPFYYADIYVDPKNENRLYNLYSVVSRSEDGGKTFKTLLPYSGVHPDHHAMWINPKNPNHIIEGNDGGLNISMDGGSTWRFIENLPVAQFYHINYDMDVPYHIYGGMQDNGSWIGPSEVWHHGGIQNADWQEVLFGDGFDVMPMANNSRYGYAMYQGGNIHTYDKETGQTRSIKPVTQDTVALRFNWNAALAQDPHNPCGVYFGSQFLHYSNDCGKSWKRLSEDLTTNDPDKQKQVESGGLTIDATQAENYTTITCIAPSPLNEDVIWVGTDDGNLWITKDKGENWSKITKLFKKDVPEGAWIPQITPSKHKQDEAFIVINDYRRNNWAPYAFKLAGYGKSYENLVNENVLGHCHSIEQDHQEENLLFLGTEYGLYFSTDQGENWNKWIKNYPSVPTVDLKIHPRDPDLIIGTFGRAAYVLDDISPLRAMAHSNDFLDRPFKLFDSPDAYLVSYKANAGSRFGADANYKTGGGSSSAKFSYFLNPTWLKESKEVSKKDTTKKDLKWDKISIAIFNINGDTIRNFKINSDTGIRHFRWFGEQNGTHFPSTREIKKDADPARGHPALPGKYLITAQIGDQIDSAQVTLKPDPRINFNFNGEREKHAVLDEFEKSVSSAKLAFDQLLAAEKNLSRMKKMAALMEDSIKTKLNKKIKPVSATIDSLKNIFVLPASFEGYDHVTKRLNNMLYDAYGYISNSEGKPSPNAMQAKKNAEKRIVETVSAINDFIETDWLNLVQYFKAQDYKMLKELKKVNNE